MKYNDNQCNEKDLGLSHKKKIDDKPMKPRGPNQMPHGGGKPEKSHGASYR